VGKPGVGKTSLVTHFALELRHKLDEAQLFVDLGGISERPADPHEVLGRFLLALGVNGATLPGLLEDRAALFRSVTTDRRIVLVLDNATDAAQVQPLLPGPGPSFTMVTSRREMTGLIGSHQIFLDVLSAADAADYLASAAGRPDLRNDPQAERIAHLCGYLPLALHVVASNLAGGRRWSTTHIARSLQNEHDRLDTLSPNDVGVRASIGVSYRRLSSDTRTTFRMLSVIPDTRFSVEVAAVATNRPDKAIGRRLEELADAHLLDRADIDGFYQFHDLLRLYARERLTDEDSQDVVVDAERRLIKALLSAAMRAGRSLTPAGQESLTPQDLPAAKEGAGLEWLDSAWTMVCGILALVVSHHLDGDLLVALRDLERYVQIRDLWDSWAHLAAGVSARAKQSDDPVLRLSAATMRANASVSLHATESMISAAEELQTLLPEINDPLLRADALIARGNIFRYINKTTGALDCYEQAHRLLTELDLQAGQSVCEHNIASVHRDCGRYDTAIAYYERDLARCRESGDRWYEAWTLNSLGGAYELTGRLDEAIEAHSTAYQIFYSFADDAFMSRCLHDLALALRKSGRIEEAIRCHIADLELAYRRTDLRGMAMSFAALGEISTGIDGDRAIAYLDQAIFISRSVGDPDTEATALLQRGKIALSQADHQARAHIEKALHMIQERGLPRRHAQLLVSISATAGLTDTERTHYVAEAIRIFEALDDVHDAEQARGILRTIGHEQRPPAGPSDR
jgi:tetratricopeptide (TPR) repeat protein